MSHRVMGEGMDPMRITVTGGAGFIGSHLVEALLADGHEVTTLDNLSTGREAHLQHVLQHPGHTLVNGDVLDRQTVGRCLAESDAVYHLAAVLGVRNCVDNPLNVIRGNLDGTRCVLEEAFARGVKVIFASTSEVYGRNPDVPFSEDADRVLGPTTVHRWCYATAKAMDEHLCLAYAKEGMRTTIIRYFNAYGPRSDNTAYSGVIPQFIGAALHNEPIRVFGSGKQTRCFTYVDDLVRGTVAALGEQADGRVFNLGTQVEVSINSLAHMIRILADSRSQIVHIPYDEAFGRGYEDTMRRVPDLSEASAALGYRAETNLIAGLGKTIQWQREHGR